MRTSLAEHPFRRTLGALALLALGGCMFFPTLPPGSVGDVISDDIPGQPNPPIDGAIRIEVVNPTAHRARVNVRMSIADLDVHDASRTVPANGTSLIVGPDNADRVVITAELIDTDAPLQGPITLLLGQDYESGDKIRFVIDAPSVLRAFVDLPDDRTVEIGQDVSFTVSAENAGPQARLAVFADRDGSLHSGDEMVILSDAPAEPVNAVVWSTSGLPPGNYRVYAELSDGAALARSELSAGTITLIPQLAVAISGIEQDVTVESGALVTFTVVTSGVVSASPTISVFAEPQDDQSDRIAVVVDQPVASGQTQIDWDTSMHDLGQSQPRGPYRLVAELDDGPRALTSAPTAGRVIILAPLRVEVRSPAEDVQVDAGEIVQLTVFTDGVGGQGALSVFAQSAGDPSLDGLVTIADGLEPTGLQDIAWDTSEVLPTTYTIFAELTDSAGDRFQRSPDATGRVIILSPLFVNISGLEEDAFVEPFGSIDFHVITGGAVGGSPLLDVFARRVDEPQDPNLLIPVALQTPALPVTPITWDLGFSKIGAGEYELFAVIRDGDRTAQSAPSSGHVIVLLPLTVDLLNFDEDVTVGEDAIVPIQIAAQGFSDPNAAVSVFAEAPEQAPFLVDRVPAAAQFTVHWDTIGIEAGPYQISARLEDGNRDPVVDQARGALIISRAPSLEFTSPNESVGFIRGQALGFGWSAFDPEENATIDFFLDPDLALNGNEIELLAGVSEDSEPTGSSEVGTVHVEPGSYSLLGVIDDGVNAPRLTYGHAVCVSGSVFGVYRPSEYTFSQVVTIEGLPDDPCLPINITFGAALAFDRDVNNDGFADLIVGDPRAARIDPDSGQVEFGAVYYHQQTGPWPFEMSVRDFHAYAEAVEPFTRFGQSVALAAPFGPSAFGEILTGAPLQSVDSELENGLAWYIDGDAVVKSPGPISLSAKGPTTSVFGSVQIAEHLGATAAGLGDVDNDGVAETAIAGPRFSSGRGRVILFSGAEGAPFGSLDGLGQWLTGAIWEGADPNELAGASLASTGSVNGDDFADVLVGAPGWGPSRNGRVYLIHGAVHSLDNETHALASLGATESGVIFVGQPGDRAGHSVAMARVNPDDVPDIVIGAPGHGDNRGRVYLVYGSADLSGTIDLAQVGVSVPGAVFEGQHAGAALGWSVAPAGDFNTDGWGDLLLGSPGDNDATGAAYLVYGRPFLTGNVSLAPDCVNPGIKLVGEDFGDEFGYAVSGGGDADGDGLTDIGIGAPGANRAYLVFGASFADPQPCNADLDGDGDVDVTDMGVLLANYGDIGEDLPGDLDNDGDVDIVDLGRLLSEFGQFCP